MEIYSVFMIGMIVIVYIPKINTWNQHTPCQNFGYLKKRQKEDKGIPIE